MNNKPIIKEYLYDTGQLWCKEYWINGKLHNPNGPAIELYYDNGQLNNKSYYLNGKRHNPNGPAYEHYFNNGELEHKAYYINNKELCYKEFCIWQFENNIIKSKAELFKALLNE